jgi:hypothetical protein
LLMTNLITTLMRSDDLLKMVERECSFLSYYLEEYEANLETDKNNEELKALVEEMQNKFAAYNKVYEYIKKVL